MFTSLDLLIVFFMTLITIGVVSTILMFLLKNKIAKRVCFYVVSTLILYVAYGGIRMGLVGSFMNQIVLGLFVALTAIASFVLERVFRRNDKVFLITRIVSASTLGLGLLNAFFI